jgi:DNA polymerase I-like protein with 3'-5' exonuclease and polymerase domains
MPTVRELLATRPERKAVTRAVLRPIQRGKRDRTVASAYARLQPDSDGRIHTGLSVATTSGRLASSDTIVEEAGTNLQNQVNKIASIDPLYNTRDVMLADEGFTLFARDYSGAEMLLAFAYSDDWEWVQRLLKGEPIHALHAKEFFGLSCPAREVKKRHKEVYTTAKNIGFASIYSASARTVTVTFNKDYAVHGQRITEKEVARLQGILYQLHPWHAWWASVEDEIRRNGGWIRNCFGSRRVLRDPDEHNRLKDALSQLPQSTVATLMNRAIIRVHDDVDVQGEIELLHQNHDELDGQARDDLLPRALTVTKAIMEVPFTIHGHTLHLPTEAKCGKRWGQLAKAEE